MQDNRLALKHSIEAKRRAGELVAQRKPFSNAGETFRGILGGPGTFGYLPDYWANKFPKRGVVYTIMSYDTPIAWLDHNGEWTVPDVKYSATTTQHQGVVAVYLLVGETRAA